MDFNLPEMKQEKLAEGIAKAPNHLHGDEIPNEKGATASATKLPDASFDLLGDIQQDVAKSGSAADENYFGDNHKMSSGGSDLGFEHVDPNAFAYGMNEKAASAMNEFSDFLGKPLGKNLADATQAFMNTERDFLGHQSAAGHLAESLMDNEKKPSDHVATTSQKIADIYDDDFFRAPKTSTTEVSDAATESPPVSCNPSPVKKNPVTDALKEQENEKFISSEDLLGDFKDDRSATPEFHGASESNTNNKQSGPKSQKIVTDLDDDKPVVVSKQTPSAPEHSTLPNVPKAPAPVVEQAKMPTNPSNKYNKGGSKDSSNKDPKILSVEAVFYKYGLDAWFKPERLHPRVESLIYWRDVKKSGIVFGAGLVTLLAISCFSVISVFAYLSLISLTGTIGFRIYKSVTQAIQKTSDGHPFKEFLELDLNLSQEKIQQFVSVAVAHINGFVAELRRLFLVEDLIDSLKFGVILWVMTYIGAWFNGMTLVILAFVSLFTLPKVYENNKQSIDTYLDLVRSKLTDITDKVKVAIPIGNKKPIATETDKDK